MKRRRASSRKPANLRQTIRAKRRAASKVAHNRRSFTASKDAEVVRLRRERDEALEREMATAEVLRVISSSPGQLEPIFHTLLEKAARICAATFGNLLLFDGRHMRLAAQHNPPPGLLEWSRSHQTIDLSTSIAGTLVRTKNVVHVADLAAEEPYASSVLSRLYKARTALGIPMLRDETLVGQISIYRQEVAPFTDKQIEFVQNFAAQAVIAIENARLLNELRRSLEQQTATSEVLSVISSSPGELEPVFQVMLENAARVCDAKFGMLFRLDDNGAIRPVASLSVPEQLMEYFQHGPRKPSEDAPIMRAARTKQPAHVVDFAAEPAYLRRNPLAVASVEHFGVKTLLVVPMLKEGEFIGAFAIYRQEVRPFTDKQIDLVKNFAAQAVIAIENTRLLNELRQRTEDLSQSLQDLRTAQDRLVQTQKLASLGQLTAGIAHEIKNPLNFVNNFSGVSVELIDELEETLGRVTADDKTRGEIAELADTLRDNLDKIVQHGKRADAIVKNMLLHSREGSGERRPIDVNALVEEALNLAYHGARAEKQGFNITLERSFDPVAGEADVYPQEISRVLINLISNGFYAATKRHEQAKGNGYEPTLTATTRNLGDRVEIRIRDNGVGIPAEIREKMFNPFFTTKPAGEGTGLGLSISHDIIVKQHSGSIEVDTKLGEFTELRITLPRTAA